MLQVARLSPQVLGESAHLVAEFLLSQMNGDGGFRDRNGKSDLYYTTFAIGGLMALQVPLPVERIVPYLRSVADVEDLGLVDAACLARCWAAMPAEMRIARFEGKVLAQVEKHRTPDGGYNADREADRGTVYGCFLALGAYQDAGQRLPEPDRMLDCIEALRTRDGGYANGADMQVGLTPPTAAAAALLRHLGGRPDERIKGWLLARLHPDGGFCAGRDVPIPDLLSTATALHALDGLHADIAPVKELCLDFVDTLWTNRGGFYGSWEDDVLDCEYTYYGLLALGHLSL